MEVKELHDDDMAPVEGMQMVEIDIAQEVVMQPVEVEVEPKQDLKLTMEVRVLLQRLNVLFCYSCYAMFSNTHTLEQHTANMECPKVRKSYQYHKQPEHKQPEHKQSNMVLIDLEEDPTLQERKRNKNKWRIDFKESTKDQGLKEPTRLLKRKARPEIKVNKKLTMTVGPLRRKEEEEPCLLCGGSESTRRHFQEAHGKDMEGRCWICFTELRSRENRINHMKIHYLPASKEHCQICGVRYGKRNVLRHISTTHTQRTLRCKLCKQLFRNRCALVNHQEYQHGILDSGSSEEEDECEVQIGETIVLSDTEDTLVIPDNAVNVTGMFPNIPPGVYQIEPTLLLNNKFGIDSTRRGATAVQDHFDINNDEHELINGVSHQNTTEAPLSSPSFVKHVQPIQPCQIDRPAFPSEDLGNISTTVYSHRAANEGEDMSIKVNFNNDEQRQTERTSNLQDQVITVQNEIIGLQPSTVVPSPNMVLKHMLTEPQPGVFAIISVYEENPAVPAIKELNNVTLGPPIDNSALNKKTTPTMAIVNSVPMKVITKPPDDSIRGRRRQPKSKVRIIYSNKNPQMQSEPTAANILVSEVRQVNVDSEKDKLVKSAKASLNKVNAHTDDVESDSSEETCVMCDSEDVSREHFLDHHAGEIMNLTCRICFNPFRNRIAFKNHMLTLHAINACFAYCQICGALRHPRKGPDHIDATEHVLPSIVQCPICKTLLFNELALSYHLVYTHGDPDRIRCNTCMLCQSHFITSLHLHNHMLSKHGNIGVLTDKEVSDPALMADIMRHRDILPLSVDLPVADWRRKKQLTPSNAETPVFYKCTYEMPSYFPKQSLILSKPFQSKTLHELPDSSHMLPDPLHILSEPSHIFPDSSDMLTEPSHILPDSSDILPDEFSMLPEPSHILPSSSDIFFDPSHILPDSSDIMSDSSAILPDPIHILPDPSHIAPMESSKSAPSLPNLKEIVMKIEIEEEVIT